MVKWHRRAFNRRAPTKTVCACVCVCVWRFFKPNGRDILGARHICLEPLRRGLLTLPLIAQQNVRSEHQAITHTPWRTHYLSGHRMEQPDERDQDRDRDRKAKVNWQVLKVTMKPKNSHFSNSFTVCTHHTHTHLHSHMHSHSHSYSYSFAHSHACTPRWTTTENLKTLHSKMHATHTHTHTESVARLGAHHVGQAGRQAGSQHGNSARQVQRP